MNEVECEFSFALRVLFLGISGNIKKKKKIFIASNYNCTPKRVVPLKLDIDSF